MRLSQALSVFNSLHFCNLLGRGYYSHFTEQEMEAHRNEQGELPELTQLGSGPSSAFLASRLPSGEIWKGFPYLRGRYLDVGEGDSP